MAEEGGGFLGVGNHLGPFVVGVDQSFDFVHGQIFPEL